MFKAPSAGTPDGPAGFTLIELMAVLAILALTAAVAVPGVVSGVGAYLHRYRQDEIALQLAGLGARALKLGQGFVLTAAEGPGNGGPLVLPPGWRLTADPPIHYRFDGVCSGGRVVLDADGRRAAWSLQPPLCRPIPGAGAGGL